MLALVVVILGGGALIVGATWKRVEPPAPAGVSVPPAPSSTGAGAAATPPPAGVPAPAVPPKKQEAGGGLGVGGAIAALGGAFGAASGLVADNQDVKAAAPTIGAGLGLAAFLFNVGGVAGMGTVGAVTFIAAPLLVATYAITVVVDRVLSAVREVQFQELIRQCAQLRADGKFAEAIEAWKVATPAIGDISRKLPNADDPVMNRLVPGYQTYLEPWPGYTQSSPPPPANRDQVRAFPELVPATIMTADGKGLPVRPLLDAAYGDVETARKAAVASSGVGLIVDGGKVVKATSGERDVRSDPAYAKALATADEWAKALSGAVPWLAGDALVRDARSAVERAVDAQRLADKQAADAAAVKSLSRTLADATAATRGTKKATTSLNAAQVAQAQRAAGEETAADRKNSSPKPSKGGTDGVA